MRPGAKSGKRIAIIGGGAAGFFAAFTAAETNPDLRIDIFEQSQRTLSKVKISGGGRCNVTHHCFDPEQLVLNYPRGQRELRGAFYRWQPRDTITWFAERGVALKAEADGRMFPTTDDSQTIIDCFHKEAHEAAIGLHLGKGLTDMRRSADGNFVLGFSDNSEIHADAVCIAVGSLKSSSLNNILKNLGHTLVSPVPSLFAFNIQDSRLESLAGVSVPNVSIQRLPKGSTQNGPVLITHRGLSGPGILRMSAWEAREIHAANYHFDIVVNWLGNKNTAEAWQDFARLRKAFGKSTVRKIRPEAIPRRFWERLVEASGISPGTAWSQLPKAQEKVLVGQLIEAKFTVLGKTTNKDEFVTCGGVRLKEVNFKTLESRLVPGLYFAGECLDIDGITGGFNFQAAWTTGRLAGLEIAKS